MHRSMSANAVKPLKEVAAVRGHRDQELVFKAPCAVVEQQRSEAPCPRHAIKLGPEHERSLLRRRRRMLFFTALLV